MCSPDPKSSGRPPSMTDMVFDRERFKLNFVGIVKLAGSIDIGGVLEQT